MMAGWPLAPAENVLKRKEVEEEERKWEGGDGSGGAGKRSMQERGTEAQESPVQEQLY